MINYFRKKYRLEKSPNMWCRTQFFFLSSPINHVTISLIFLATLWRGPNSRFETTGLNNLTKISSTLNRCNTVMLLDKSVLTICYVIYNNVSVKGHFPAVRVLWITVHYIITDDTFLLLVYTFHFKCRAILLVIDYFCIVVHLLLFFSN